MKKYLLVMCLLVFPLVSKAALMGFSDGNMYDPSTGTWKCVFLMDGNCYDLNQNVLTTRPSSNLPIGGVSDPSPIVQAPLTSPVQPIQAVQPTPTPTPVLLPAYTESELQNRFKTPGDLGQALNVEGTLRDWPLVTAFPLSTANSNDYNISGLAGVVFDCTHVVSAHIVFNNSNVLDCMDTSSVYGTPRVIIGNLQPSTTYSYQYIYTESGRQDSIFTKSFHTPSN